MRRSIFITTFHIAAEIAIQIADQFDHRFCGRVYSANGIIEYSATDGKEIEWRAKSILEIVEDLDGWLARYSDPKTPPDQLKRIEKLIEGG